MPKRRYVLVDTSALPEVFMRVLHAKELLAGGKARNVSQATRAAGVSRSAFYKYKDSIFMPEADRAVATITVRLLDETGALQALLAGISSAGAGVVTINQGIPESGAATVAVTVRTEGMRCGLDDLADELARQRTVIDVKTSR